MDNFGQFAFYHRRWVAAALVGLAVFSAVSALHLGSPAEPLLVASRDLDSGHIVQPDDLEKVNADVGYLPSNAVTSPDDVIGRHVTGAMRTGEPFTDRRTVDPRVLGDGLVLTPLTIETNRSSFIRVGDAIDVIAAPTDGESGAHVVATKVPVLYTHTDDALGTTTLGIETPPEIALSIVQYGLHVQFTVMQSS